MKKTIYLLLLSVAFTSCKKWLDINDNPSSPNSSVPAPEQRLPPIIAQFADGYESAGTRVAFLAQQLAVTYANSNNWNLTRWYSNSSSANWPWQSWYVNTAVNLQPLIEASEKVGAYHYIGVAKIIKAWGFGYLADFYGMLPYDEFDVAGNLTPKFDDGAYVQEKVLALLDEAIADLQKTQEVTAPSLAQGDILNQGNVDNWIRLANGLKARFLNHLVKRPEYNPQAVLDALAAAPQTDDQSAIIQYVDEEGVADNSKAALQYVNIGLTGRVTKLYYDYLSNDYTGAPSGTGNMADPRINLLIPHMENASGELVQTQFVDMASTLPLTGPASYSYRPASNSFSSKDSVYVQMRAAEEGGRILSTGSWYTQRGGKGLLLTNAEMRFIEAEVELRLGQSAEALAAYKAGIRSHMSIIGIEGALIEQFLNSSSVIQNPGDLTMSHVMIQKYIALSYSPEVWCDLRRMNYCTDASGSYNETVGIYKGFKRPAHTYVEAYPSPNDWPRRFAVPSYEINYNIEQVLTANPNAAAPTYLNEPVWWDQP
ncbi:SusD/RagB family nutrient-binding outer membrane lipoprotein [Olivibacter sp. XZL3]|uniref:SusD/RagB family nutrient-binding outer membrane lipoprotein n=1 Tax=Olivibacter sp. XZL3 TaxID=1735116 RepID=UPI001065BA84|nr:SusD/RagB family nutrient-binding outer membrane lipoprotein [Olivibacter sp. XZL3]